MRSYTNAVRRALHDIIQSPEVNPWLTVYASPEADQSELERALIEKMRHLLDDDPSCSPFWGREAHYRLKDLCVGTWRRRLVARAVLDHIIREDVRNGLIITDPGSMWRGERIYMLSLRKV